VLVEQQVDLNGLQTINLEIRRQYQNCDTPILKQSNNRTMQNFIRFKVELDTPTDFKT